MSEYFVLKSKIVRLKAELLLRRSSRDFIHSWHQECLERESQFAEICADAGMTPEQKKKIFDSGDEVQVTNEELDLMIKVFQKLEAWDQDNHPK